MRVAVVGTCASGKSTIVEALQHVGIDAYVVGQEHSIVADLWARQQPDALVYLDAGFATIQERRGHDWPLWIYNLQIERLRNARDHATVIIDTSDETVDESVSRITSTLGELSSATQP